MRVLACKTFEYTATLDAGLIQPNMSIIALGGHPFTVAFARMSSLLALLMLSAMPLTSHNQVHYTYLAIEHHGLPQQI